MNSSRTYAEWFDIARAVRINMPSHKKFRDGVERSAALAALKAPNDREAQICAIELEFHRFSHSFRSHRMKHDALLAGVAGEVR